MTVKELKEQLEKFDDRLLVMIPNHTLDPTVDFWCIAANDVYQGVNEADGCLFIDYTCDDDEENQSGYEKDY